MAKRRYSEHFRQVAVERMKGCDSIVTLTKELGGSRRQLYRWRDELDPGEPEVGKPPGQKSRISTLRKQVNHLKRVLAEKTLEVDFFVVIVTVAIMIVVSPMAVVVVLMVPMSLVHLPAFSVVVSADDSSMPLQTEDAPNVPGPTCSGDQLVPNIHPPRRKSGKAL